MTSSAPKEAVAQTTTSAVETVAAPAIATIPVVTKTVGTTVVVNAKKPTMHIGIPDSFIGLAKAKRATLQAVEAQLIMSQAITSAMDMPGS